MQSAAIICGVPRNERPVRHERRIASCTCSQIGAERGGSELPVCLEEQLAARLRELPDRPAHRGALLKLGAPPHHAHQIGLADARALGLLRPRQRVVQEPGEAERELVEVKPGRTFGLALHALRELLQLVENLGRVLHPPRAGRDRLPKSFMTALKEHDEQIDRQIDGPGHLVEPRRAALEDAERVGAETAAIEVAVVVEECAEFGVVRHAQGRLNQWVLKGRLARMRSGRLHCEASASRSTREEDQGSSTTATGIASRLRRRHRQQGVRARSEPHEGRQVRAGEAPLRAVGEAAPRHREVRELQRRDRHRPGAAERAAHDRRGRA